MSFDEYIDSLEIEYEEIESATNNFSDENLIGEASSCKVYKGQLLDSGGQLINIVTRKYQRSQFEQAYKEMFISCYYRHKNMCPVFKITKQDDIILIVNRHEVNGSLDKHLGGSTTLTWIQRLNISLGVAHALSYLHNYNLGNDHYFIHGNIKSSKILLDHNWKPKVHGFGFSQQVKRKQSYFASQHNGTVQYMDPAYENTNTLTSKSDVFSFGVVLFEVLFGTIASIQNGDHWYFARLARSHYEKKTLDDMIDPDLRKQMNLQSLEIFSKVAYYCLKEQRGARPDMDQIVKRLEAALELQQKHQTPPEHSRAAIGTTLSDNFRGKNLDHLRIRLSDIELATNKFSEANYIGSGAYGTVYKAELEHFDATNIPAIEKGEFAKRRSTVAIKCIFRRPDEQGNQGFLTEIELLTTCNHPNVVSLLGFSEEGRERILVYEYASNGSLNDYLGNVNNITNLSWAQRIQICLDIAHGMNYLHNTTEEKQMIIHRDIKSDNILLDDNWVAKIADFGLSKLRPADLKASTLDTVNIAGTPVYLDPEYKNTGKLRKASDIYSFGVVLFEIMCGRVAYDEIFNANNDNGLPSTVRRCVTEGTLKDLVDPKLKETHENIYVLNGVLNQDSLDTFIKIAYQCLADTQIERPTIKVIIEELEKALTFQKNSRNNFQIPLKDIKLATQNFSDDKCIGEGRYWKQYEGELPHADVCTTLVAKRFDNKSIQGHQQFLQELKALSEHKHDNIVALVGYCNEMGEKIVVHEHCSNGSLDKHLDDGSLKWMKRLKICINVASGLFFLHKEGMIHRDIKSASIVIDGDWKAKIFNLELITGHFDVKEIEHVTSSLSYVDPLLKTHGHLTRMSDIYSLGMILIEMLSGRLASTFEESASDLVQKYKSSTKALDELVFEDIKQHSDPQSLTTFFKIASQCLELDDDNRPKEKEVLIQLNKALELQEDYEIWEPKLPTDYKEIILMSNTPEIYSNKPKKDIYGMLAKGILLQQGKLWFVLGGNGERNEMIPATNFSYKNHWLRRWKSIPESRFQKVAQMSDISNLKIQIKIKTQLLSPGVNYVVHLVFKFRRPKKCTAKSIYVNLNYKMGRENLHAYFARRREDGWMSIELCQFLNHRKDTGFEVLLESFSRCYCGRRLNYVYVEGIEFQAIDYVKYEEIEKRKDVQQVLKSCSKLNEVQLSPIDRQEIVFDEELYSLTAVNGKKHLMLSAVGALYDSSKLETFHVKRSTESRFQVVIELLRQQVFDIKCKIGSQMLLPDTDYVCYLVFKLSEKCSGLHCPVRVRNVLEWKNKEIGLVCFRPPGNRELMDNTIWVPKETEDGWMEVIVWKFNSTSQIRNDCIPMHLKLITYEGTLSGLIVSGLEIRTK